MFKIRFNLEKGLNFNHWEIKQGKEKVYVDPNKKSLILIDCKLINNKNIATKIYNGEDKRVCAWIVCENYKIVDKLFCASENEIRYNPRISINWQNSKLENIDNFEFKKIISVNKKLFLINTTN